MDLKVNPIGTVEEATENSSRLRILPQFLEGIQGLEQFSHAIVLYWFDKRDNKQNRLTLKVTPRRHPGAREMGVFATRSPSRPNPIGICVVEVLEIHETTLVVRGLDAFNGSPIVDVKPYIPRADSVAEARTPEWTNFGPPT